MFAIVEIYGKQYKVAKGDTLLVDSKIDIAVGKTLKFDNVKAISDKDANIFNPKELDSYKVSAKVLEHKKANKVTIIKKKRRKGYQKSNGHRQYLTELVIEGIGAGAKKAPAKKAAAPKAEKVTATAEKAPAKKAAPKKEAAPKAEAKKAAPKKETKKED